MGALNADAGEFWMENPWQVGDHNVSAYERNRILLNSRNRSFVDISHLTTADTDSDSRSVVSGDLNQDGMPDIVVRSSGGGALRVFLNRFPQTRWLKVSLRGIKSNRQGIGAKLIFEVGGQKIWRELYPMSSFYSQEASLVHIGIGNNDRIDRVTVAWPSGITQTFEDIAADQHILIQEDNPSAHPFPGTSTDQASNR